MNNYIQKLLKRIGEMMDGYMPFEKLESHVLEVKDLSGAKGAKDWNELYKTVCAFLNTDGGLVICGIRENEKEKTYQLKGFDSANEDKIRAELTSGNHFTDDARNPLKLDHKNINFKLFNFRLQQVAVVNVHPFADDEKFVFYKKENTAYIREMTGDKKVTKVQLEAHQEYKRELEYARELRPVPNTTIEDLDLEKIRELIDTLQSGGTFLNTPKTLEEAIPFLEDNYFLRNDLVTVLGMLTCGKKPFYHLDKRAEVDCFLETEESHLVVADKRYIKDTILSLMEESFRFILRNIRIGTSYENGGTHYPEYPQDVIREVVNNAIAHRDYKANRPVQIIIKPNEEIVVKNPGTFSHKTLLEIPDENDFIWRIIPPKGTPESKNPKLANFLKKVSPHIENRGVGVATLVNEALENRIGMPYYGLDTDTIILHLREGKVLDKKVQSVFKMYAKFIEDKIGNPPTESQLTLLAYFFKAEDEDRNGNASILLTQDNNHLNVITELVDSQLIDKHPSSPKHYPIYRVHRQLRKMKYYDELKEIFGDERIAGLTFEEKRILNAFYIKNRFNLKSGNNAVHKHVTITHSNILDFMYYQEHKTMNNDIYSEFVGSNIILINKFIRNEDFFEFSEEYGYQINDSK